MRGVLLTVLLCLLVQFVVLHVVSAVEAGRQAWEHAQPTPIPYCGTVDFSPAGN